MVNHVATPARTPVLKLRPVHGWQNLGLLDVWKFRSLLVTLGGRDLKLRYRQTFLGVVWVALQPILASAIFAVVFGRVAHLPSDGVPYFVFSYAGLLGWNTFNGLLTRVSVCLVTNTQLISKVFFPRLVLPLSAVVSTAVDFLVALALLFIIEPIYHVHMGLAVLTLPLWFLLLTLLSLGVGLVAAALAVTYRDVQYILPVATQFLMYASPVAYSIGAVPPAFRAFYFLNPLSGLLEAFRWSLLGVVGIDWNYVAYSAVISILVFVLGAYAFKRMEQGFADVI